MKIPPIIILRRGNHRNRLTVNAHRITLKLRHDVDEDGEKNLIKFAKMVAQRVIPIYFRTMRGTFSNDLQSIEMQNSNRSSYVLYCSDELSREGLTSIRIKSDCVTSKRQSYSGAGAWNWHGTSGYDGYDGFTD